MGAKVGVPLRKVTDIWELVRIGDNCWEWCGSVNPKHGYGRIKWGTKLYRAHRLIWELFYEKPTPSLLRHTCDNKLCVRPSHLVEGTQVDNIKDKVSRNRQAKGTKINTSKLTEIDVLCIREAARRGVSSRHLASQYGVSRVNINYIIAGKTWAYLIPETAYVAQQ